MQTYSRAQTNKWTLKLITERMEILPLGKLSVLLIPFNLLINNLHLRGDCNLCYNRVVNSLTISIGIRFVAPSFNKTA